MHTEVAFHPSRLLSLSLVMGGVVFADLALVGSRQAPPAALHFVIAAWLVPIALLLWLRAERAYRKEAVPEWYRDWWLLLLGPFLILFAVVRTARSRVWWRSALAIAALLSPVVGFYAGGYTSWLLGIPPRYLQISDGGEFVRLTPETSAQIVSHDFEAVAKFLGDEQVAGHPLPKDIGELYKRWYQSHPGGKELIDPFTGLTYVYERREGGFILWSGGPDKTVGTDDDPWYDGRPTTTGPQGS